MHDYTVILTAGLFTAHPEVTLCSWQDVEIHVVTCSLHSAEVGLLALGCSCIRKQCIQCPQLIDKSCQTHKVLAD